MAGAAPLEAASELLFVFSAGSSRAAVHDPSTLRPIARPEVGIEARQAFGVADGSGGFTKFYLVGARGIVVLDEGFAVSGSVYLGAGVSPGASPAGLSPDGARLVVSAGDGVYVIDVESGAVVAHVASGFAPRASVMVAVLDRRAFLYSPEANRLKILDLESSLILEGALEPPVRFDSLAVSPDGATVYASAGRAIYDLTAPAPELLRSAAGPRVSAVSFAPRPGPAAGLRLADGGRFALSGGQELLYGRFGAGRAAQSRGGEKISALALSRAGRWAVVSSSNKIRRINTLTGESSTAVEVEGRVVGLSLVSASLGSSVEQKILARVEQPSLIVKVSGDGAVAANADFDLVVTGPAGGVPLIITPSSGVVTCPGPGEVLLSQMTTITCTAGDVQTATQVVITVTAVGLGQVEFTVIVTPTGPNGLSKLAGDNATVGPNSAFQITVVSRESGLPKAADNLTVLPSVAPPLVSCNSPVTTDLNGEAAIACTSGDVQATQQITIDVSNATDMVQFTITLQPAPLDVDTLTRVTFDPITVGQEMEFTLTVEARSGGVPRQGLGVNFLPGSALITCQATLVITGADGRASVTCTAGMVSSGTSALLAATDGMRNVLFTVNIRPVLPPGAEGIFKLAGDKQVFPRNSTTPTPLLVVALAAGTPQVGIELQVNASSGVVFCPAKVFTGPNGEAGFSCSSGPVAANTPATVEVTDGARTLSGGPFQLTVTSSAAGDATKLTLLSSRTIRVPIGQTAPGAIRVRATDNLDQPVAGAPVFFSTALDVTLEPSIVVTALSGDAAADVTAACPPGPGTIQAGLTQGGNEVIVNFEPLPGLLALITKSQGDNQSGLPGQRLSGQALVVILSDVCGNAFAGQAVEWTVNPPGAATLENVVNITDARGRSSVIVRLGFGSGPFEVMATAGALSASFTLTIVNPASRLVAESGGEQKVPVRESSALPVVARVLNDAGLGVGGIEVAFRIVSGDASVDPTLATSNADGRVSATVTMGSTLGPVTVEAAAIGIAVQFSLEAVGRVPQVILAGLVNAASFIPGWAPGGAGTVFGTGLMEGVDGILQAPATLPPLALGEDGRPSQSGGVFPIEFRGVSVTINGIRAPILALANVNGQEQINIQIPFEIASQTTATVVIANNGSETTLEGVPIFGLQPGIFEIFVDGGRFAAALHPDFSVVTPSNPARPGEIIAVFLTGMGATDPPVGTNRIGPIPAALTVVAPVVGIDNAGVVNFGGFYAPRLVSAYQVNFQLAENTPPGLRRLKITQAGASTQETLLPVGP